MSSRVPTNAPIGSLLKQPAFQHPRKRPTRAARIHDDGHLALVRKCPCLSCGMDPAGVAAHVRASSATHGKPNPGMGVKPDDKWTLPLCNECHDRQHQIGELPFWYELGLSPVHECERLYRVTGSLEAMRDVIFSVRRV